ncbi:MAG TPA: Flp family type IVb pilin [Planctomycetota bacterium]|nr:Flp family type IVb pilin [Planctomycetota bacterium]
MHAARTKLVRLVADDHGLETVEYAIIAGLIVVGLITVATAIGVWVKRRLNSVKTGVGA